MKELNKQLSSNILSQVVGESSVLGKCQVGRGTLRSGRRHPVEICRMGQVRVR